MAKANLGTKRVCPETGKKFYDLDKDPIVSPYTQKEYPLTFFEGEAEPTAPKPEDAEKPANAETEDATAEEEIALDDDAPEIISLEDADEDAVDDDDSGDDIPDIPDVDVDLDDDDTGEDDDTFLETDDEDDDLSDVIVGVDSDNDEV